MPDADRRLLPAFKFRVTLRRSAEAEAGASGVGPPAAGASGPVLGDGGFQECSGLEIEMEVREHAEGGRNDGVIRQVGRGKYVNLVLKRGMFYDEAGRVNPALWQWLQSVLAGVRPVARYDGMIEVQGGDGRVIATWTFDRGLPARLRGPELNARTGEIAIEELHIAHEGLRLTS